MRLQEVGGPMCAMPVERRCIKAHRSKELGARRVRLVHTRNSFRQCKHNGTDYVGTRAAGTLRENMLHLLRKGQGNESKRWRLYAVQ